MILIDKLFVNCIFLFCFLICFVIIVFDNAQNLLTTVRNEVNEICVIRTIILVSI